jgi:peroxiredoxin
MGSDYSALNSWIPGGTIDRFEWRSATDPPPGFVDENRFVLIHQPPPASAGTASRATVLAGFAPLCLTVRGSRLSSSGPIVAQAVSATVCGISGFSLLNDLAAADLQPTIAVTAPGQHGHAIVGHMAAHVDNDNLGTPNLLVRFARRGLEGTDILTKALATTNRQGTSVAVVVVAPNDILSKATLSADVVYSADVERWAKRLGVEQSAEDETVIVAPNGRVTWRHRGAIDAKDLSAALEKNLAAGPPVNRLLFTSSTRHGHAAPNFLFDYAPGRQLSLRKLAGRPATIVFWTTHSEPSIAAVREETRSAGEGAVVLAVNVGDPPDLVAREAKRHELSATIVNDVSGEIARGYGVTVFPTIVSVEASGAVAAIRYGRQPAMEPEQDSPKADKRSA